MLSTNKEELTTTSNDIKIVIKLLAKNLIDSINQVIGLVNPRPLHMAENALKLTFVKKPEEEGFSLDISVFGENKFARVRIDKIEVECDLVEETVFLPAIRFSRIISTIQKEEEIRLEISKISMKIFFTDAHFRITRLADIGNFPEEPKEEIEFSLSIDTQKFVRSLKKTEFSMGWGCIRESLNCLRLSYTDDSVFHVVASDMHRLAHASFSTVGAQAKKKDSAGEYEALIPNHAISEIIRFLGFCEGEKSITIHVGECNVCIEISGRKLYINRVNEKFPKFDRLLEIDEYTVRFSERKDWLIPRLKQLFSVTMVDKTPMGILFESSDEGFFLKSSNQEGDGVEINCKDIKVSNNISIFFNAKYILQMISNIEGETVQMCIGGDKLPAKITGEGQDIEIVYLLMPKINE